MNYIRIELHCFKYCLIGWPLELKKPPPAVVVLKRSCESLFKEPKYEIV